MTTAEVSCLCRPQWLAGVGPPEGLGEHGVEVVDECRESLAEIGERRE